MFWFILCEAEKDYDEAFGDQDTDDSNRFFIAYDLGDNAKSNYEKMIAMFYFASTTLTTVGFGDFNPKSDIERMLCAAIMMFGVMIFSYILGIFMEMID